MFHTSELCLHDSYKCLSSFLAEPLASPLFHLWDGGHYLLLIHPTYPSNGVKIWQCGTRSQAICCGWPCILQSIRLCSISWWNCCSLMSEKALLLTYTHAWGLRFFCHSKEIDIAELILVSIKVIIACMQFSTHPSCQTEVGGHIVTSRDSPWHHYWESIPTIFSSVLQVLFGIQTTIPL